MGRIDEASSTLRLGLKMSEVAGHTPLETSLQAVLKMQEQGMEAVVIIATTTNNITAQQTATTQTICRRGFSRCKQTMRSSTTTRSSLQRRSLCGWSSWGPCNVDPSHIKSCISPLNSPLLTPLLTPLFYLLLSLLLSSLDNCTPITA